MGQKSREAWSSSDNFSSKTGDEKDAGAVFGCGCGRKVRVQAKGVGAGVFYFLVLTLFITWCSKYIFGTTNSVAQLSLASQNTFN